MRERPHHHPCATCGEKVECSGSWEQNWDGFPEVICREFHQDRWPFLCEDCHTKAEADARAEQEAEV